MLVRKVVTTEAAPKAVAPYSQAIKVENFLFISGQLPLAPQTGFFTLEELYEYWTKKGIENQKTRRFCHRQSYML